MQKYADVVMDRKGNVVTTATVLVKTIGGASATIYATNSIAQAANNPIAVDNLGRFSFYAPNGRYSLEIYIGSALFSISSDILLEDPADATPEVIDGGLFKNGALENVTIDGLPPLRSDRFVTENRTINVPAEYPTVAAAMNYLRTLTVASGVVVTIKIADQVAPYNNTPVNLNHPQGVQLRIIGNTADKTKVVLVTQLPITADAFYCGAGYTFGLIDGVIIKTASKSGSGIGVIADNGGHVNIGPNTEIDGYYYSAVARNGGTCYAPGVTSKNAGDVGMWAFRGGVMICDGATISDAVDAVNGLGYGAQAEYGGRIECSGAKISGCLIAGVAALSGGVARAHGINSSNNTGTGVKVGPGGYVALNGSTLNNNGTWGVDRSGDGIVAGSYTATGNALGSQKPVAYFDNETNPSLLVNSGADLNIGTNGNNAVNINIQGRLSLKVFSEGPAAVNYAQIESSIAGSPVRFKARGADANIDLSLEGRGTGMVRFGTATAVSGATTIVEYFSHKLQDGRVVKLAIIA